MLKPIFKGERIRICRCGHLGISSPIRERSSYYPKRSINEYVSLCKTCSKEKNKRYRKTLQAQRNARARDRSKETLPIATLSPEQQAKRRAQWRAAKRRAKEQDPDGTRLRYNESKRRAYRRKLERIGPEGMREERRFKAMRLRELAGKPLPTVREDKIGTSGVKWPSGPYQAFLNRLAEKASKRIEMERGLRSKDGELAHGSYGAVAQSLGISERRLYDHLRSETVDERIVERTCAREGGLHPGELYPHAYERGPTIWGSGTPKDPYQVLPEGWRP